MMGIFTDKRGLTAKLFKSNTITFDDVQDWGLGTIIIAAGPHDMAMPMCIAYVLLKDGKHVAARIIDSQKETFGNYRLTLQLDGDGKRISVSVDSKYTSFLVSSGLLLKSCVNLRQDTQLLFSLSPLMSDPWFNLGVNTGIRHLLEKLDEQTQQAIRSNQPRTVDRSMLQAFMAISIGKHMVDAQSVGAIVGYFSALRNLEVIGTDMLLRPELSRIVAVRTISGITAALEKRPVVRGPETLPASK